MKIVYLAQFAGSNWHGMGLAQFSLAREWRDMGCDVEIIAASFSHTRVKQPDVGTESQYIDSVKYRWIPVRPYRSMAGRIFAMFQYTYAVIKLFSRTKNETRDVVIFSSYHPFIYCAMKVLSRIPSGALSVVEVRDLWGESLKYLVAGVWCGVSRIASFFVSKLEDYSYRNCDLVVSSLIDFPDYLAQRKVHFNSKNFLWVRNAVAPVDLSVREEDLEKQALIALGKVRERAQMLLVYTGSIGRATGFEVILKFLSVYTESFLVVVGEGDRKSQFYEMAEAMGVENRIVLLPAVERGALKNVIAMSDLCVCAYRASPLYRFGVSPTKLGDYLQAGKPVLYCGNAPLGIPKKFYIDLCRESELEVREKLKTFCGEFRGELAGEISTWTKGNFTAEIEARRYLDFLVGHGASIKRASLNRLPVVE